MSFPHIAALSNAVLVAIMPQVSDFAKKLDLPLPQPIPLNQVVLFRQVPRKDSIMGAVVVSNGTNKFLFSYADGGVNGFKMDHNPFLDDDPANDWKNYAFGKDNMTTNAAIEMARDSIRKLGFDPKDFNADISPTQTKGDYYLKDGNHVPYLQIKWDSPPPDTYEERTNAHYLEFTVDLEKKRLISLSIISQKICGKEPKIEIPPEPQIQGKWLVRTNAPSPSVQTNSASP